MRHVPLSVSGSLAAALLCAAFGLPSAHAQTSPYPNAPAASVAKSAAQNETSKVFVLRWIKPSRFVELIAPSANQDGQTTAFLILSGITRLSPDDATKRFTVRGKPEAVERMDEIIRLLDVEPRHVRMTARILRAPALKGLPTAPPFASVGLDDKLPKSEVVTTVTGAFSNHETLTLSAIGDGRIFRVRLTPHVNGDDSVSVTAAFSPLPTLYGNMPSELAFSSTTSSDTQSLKSAQTTTRRVANGGAGYMLYTPSGQNKEQAYYLEVTPFVLPRQEQP